MTADHTPHRPAWLCDQCGKPWPCSPARVELGEQYGRDRVALAMYTSTMLVDAAAEIGDQVEPPELYERFVAWTR